MWGALRAYCNQRVVFDQDPGRFRGEYPEIALLERVAGIMEREMEDGGNPFRYVPATLRTMAKNLKKCTKPENVLASKDFVWKSPDRGVAVRILENG